MQVTGPDVHSKLHLQIDTTHMYTATPTAGCGTMSHLWRRASIQEFIACTLYSYGTFLGGGARESRHTVYPNSILWNDYQGLWIMLPLE